MNASSYIDDFARPSTKSQENSLLLNSKTNSKNSQRTSTQGHLQLFSHLQTVNNAGGQQPGPLEHQQIFLVG